MADYEDVSVDDLVGDGFFDGEDVSEISDDPFGIPDGTYDFKVVKAYIKKTKDDTKVGLNVQLSCTETAYRGIPVWSQWRRVPMKADADFNQRLISDDDSVRTVAQAEYARLQAQLKRDLMAYGLTAKELKAKPSELLENLIDRKVRARIANEKNEDGQNDKKVKALYVYDEVSDEVDADDFNDADDF